MQTPRKLAALPKWLALCLLFGLSLGRAHARERLLLTNGFDLVCDHHASVDHHIRAYLSASETDYVDLAPGAVRAVEILPQPQPQPQPQPLPQSQAGPADQPRAAAAAPAPAAPEKLTAADLAQLVHSAGSAHNVDEDLLASVVHAESDGHSRAVSRAGARGLMQLMPATAAQLGVADAFRPEENVQGGATYLDLLLSRYHDNLALALAAYNAGPEAVDLHHGVPPYRETRAYVARVIHEFNRRVALREQTSAARN